MLSTKSRLTSVNRINNTIQIMVWFGCSAYKHVPEKKGNKLDAWANKAIFVKYGDNMDINPMHSMISYQIFSSSIEM